MFARKEASGPGTFGCLNRLPYLYATRELLGMAAYAIPELISGKQATVSRHSISYDMRLCGFV